MENSASSPAKSSADLPVLVREAIDAFWEKIVEHFPEARGGDLSPERTIRLQLMAEEAVKEWIANNVSIFCTTCHSEIVETVNASNFPDGQCGPCEYRRYQSVPLLLDAANASLGFVLAWEKERGITKPSALRLQLEAVLPQTDGDHE